MSKITCEVCGTVFPDTASNCPICGWSPTGAEPKAEVGKPFPQEQELAAKTARLIELDMELNLDGKGQPQPEQAIAKSARPSVLDRLKASPVHGAPEKPHKKEMEAR